MTSNASCYNDDILNTATVANLVMGLNINRKHYWNNEGTTTDVYSLLLSDSTSVDLTLYSNQNRFYNVSNFISNQFIVEPKMNINCTVMDKHNCEALSFWGGFTKMIDTDTLIDQVVKVFRQFTEVSEIYYLLRNNEVEYFVLLDNESYDRQLMRQLFKIERLIKNTWSKVNLEVHYAPIKHIDKEIILKGFHIAYRKG